MKNYFICSIYVSVALLQGCSSIEDKGTKSIPAQVAQKTCLGCGLTKGELGTIGGILAETPYFQVRQDYAIPIPGFVIIGSKRHIQSIDEFTPAERTDFIELLYTMRKRMRERLSIDTVYLIQEEDSSHFHIWLFPRYDWMKEFGKEIKSVNPIMQWARENLTKSEDIQAVKEAAEKLKS